MCELSLEHEQQAPVGQSRVGTGGRGVWRALPPGPARKAFQTKRERRWWKYSCYDDPRAVS